LLQNNPYLGNFVNQHSELFAADRTLKLDDRRVKGELAGAVLLKQVLPTIETPQTLPVAIPVRATNDNRAYVATLVSSKEVAPEVLDGQNRHEIAHELATHAIFGYLSDSSETHSLHASERRIPVAEALWHNR
jgi:hypothetical protein